MLHEGTMHCVHLSFCFFPTAPASQHRMQPAAGWLVVQLLASSPVLCQNHLATWQLTWIRRSVFCEHLTKCQSQTNKQSPGKFITQIICFHHFWGWHPPEFMTMIWIPSQKKTKCNIGKLMLAKLLPTSDPQQAVSKRCHPGESLHHEDPGARSKHPCWPQTSHNKASSLPSE